MKCNDSGQKAEQAIPTVAPIIKGQSFGGRGCTCIAKEQQGRSRKKKEGTDKKEKEKGGERESRSAIMDKEENLSSCKEILQQGCQRRC